MDYAMGGSAMNLRVLLLVFAVIVVQGLDVVFPDFFLGSGANGQNLKDDEILKLS